MNTFKIIKILSIALSLSPLLSFSYTYECDKSQLSSKELFKASTLCKTFQNEKKTRSLVKLFEKRTQEKLQSLLFMVHEMYGNAGFTEAFSGEILLKSNNATYKYFIDADLFYGGLDGAQPGIENEKIKTLFKSVRL